jgi:hypothetical protein
VYSRPSCSAIDDHAAPTGSFHTSCGACDSHSVEIVTPRIVPSRLAPRKPVPFGDNSGNGPLTVVATVPPVWMIVGLPGSPTPAWKLPRGNSLFRERAGEDDVAGDEIDSTRGKAD